MKQKNEMASKAGKPKTESGNNLLSRISKSASMLLILMIGLGTMSFTQDDTSVAGIDSNLRAEKKNIASLTIAANNACCRVNIVNPGDGIRNAYYISLPDNRTMAQADAEAVAKFATDALMRRLWSMDIATAIEEADTEIKLNFRLRNIYPSFAVAKGADAKMIDIFTGDIVLKNVNYTTAGLTAADIEVADNFVADQLSENNMFSTVELIAKADAELKDAFNKTNTAWIGLPSKIMADNADSEMVQAHQSQNKFPKIVATK